MIMSAVRRGWHITGKMLAFVLFGIGGLSLALGVFPVIMLVARPEDRFRKIMRFVLGKSFGLFVFVIKVLGLVHVTVINKDALKQAKRMIICANHPSLIDVVFLIGMIPRCDCIVKAKLWSNPFVQGVVRNVYIPNSLSPAETIAACERSFQEDNNLVLFPEGTRTIPGAMPKFHRSAARIALRTGRPIIPVRITIPDAQGMQKGDHLFSSPRNGVLELTIEVMEPLEPGDYAHMEEPLAARHLTDKLQTMLK